MLVNTSFLVISAVQSEINYERTGINGKFGIGMLRNTAIVLLASITITACKTTESTVKKSTADNGKTEMAAAKKDDKKDKMKKYSEVVTDKAITDEGLFAVHKVDDKYYYEIPDTVLGREMLLVSRIAKTADNLGYGGEESGEHVVRWVRRGDDVLLRIVSYDNVADEGEPLYKAVESSNFEPIVQTFAIEALGKDSNSVVIDVTPLLSKDVPVLGLSKSRRDRYKVRRLDDSRTFVDSVRSYPRNIEATVIMTYEASEPPSNSSTGSISIEMNHSMVLLPDEPMMPRLCDQRVGYFSVRQTRYSDDVQKADEKCYITRWRLEPSDAAAFRRGELVEPVKPIVYYIDPATPMKWRPYLKSGVEAWNAAFEKAGFKNAIIAKDPPSAEEDPEFSPEDVRYSVIRYFASDVQNAYGPHVSDPRTGEILESDIGWYHNVMNLLRNWFFVQTAAINPSARGVEFDDAVMGSLIEFVSSHEVGHTLGLPHNWGSSAAYPVDSLRSASFTQRMGTAPAIMDYARFNYVAQPGDGDVGLMPKVGPYDKWSIEWGYRPIPAASSPEAERTTLNEWIIERAGNPMYFFGRTSSSRLDPRSQNEDLGDDAVKASMYGLENLKRIVPNLVEWTEENGKDYDDLAELYQNVAAQYNRYIGHVVTNIGGMYENYKTYDQSGAVYTVVPAERQREAMAFIQDVAFQRPDWLLNSDVLSRIEHAGSIERVRSMQVSALNRILDPQVIARLIEGRLNNDDSYSPEEMFDAMRNGVFADVNESSIDAFRRNLQRGYVERMKYLMNAELTPPPAAIREFVVYTPVDVAQSDIRAYARGELETLRSELNRAAARRHDRISRYHIKDLIARVDEILEGDDD